MRKIKKEEICEGKNNTEDRILTDENLEAVSGGMGGGISDGFTIQSYEKANLCDDTNGCAKQKFGPLKDHNFYM